MAINYTYKIEARPEQMFVRFTYSADGKPDTYKNLNTVTDFSESNLRALAEEHSQGAIGVWAVLDNVVIEDGFQTEITGTSLGKSRVQIAGEPDYDRFTQRLEHNVTETETEIIESLVAVDLTEEEKIQYKIDDAKAYLAYTDWVSAKLAEEQAGLINVDIKAKYADIFIAREEARNLINSLEG